jgi:hypothetical protein
MNTYRVSQQLAQWPNKYLKYKYTVFLGRMLRRARTTEKCEWRTPEIGRVLQEFSFFNS